MAKSQPRKRMTDRKRASRSGGKKSAATGKPRAGGKAAARVSSKKRKREPASRTGKPRGWQRPETESIRSNSQGNKEERTDDETYSRARETASSSW